MGNQRQQQRERERRQEAEGLRQQVALLKGQVASQEKQIALLETDSPRPVGGEEKKPKMWRRLLKYLITAFVGAALSLIFTAWIVDRLPSPTVSVGFQTFLGSGGVTGGIFYMIHVSTDEPLEHVFLKFQFPETINNYNVGYPPQYYKDRGLPDMMQVYVLGTNASGAHEVKQAPGGNPGTITAWHSANMITIQAPKLERNVRIMGMIATTTNKSNIYPPPKLSHEGTYDYIRLGRTVRKPMRFENLGVANTAPPPGVLPSTTSTNASSTNSAGKSP